MGDLRLESFPMPSHVTRIGVPHTNFGDITLVMRQTEYRPKSKPPRTPSTCRRMDADLPQVEYAADPAAEAPVSGGCGNCPQSGTR